MNGSIAIGSRRTTPTAPVAAADVSDDSVAPMNVPWVQSRDSYTSGTVVLRRPPNRIASIGTPSGLSYSGAIIGHCLAGVQNRLFGWAALVPASPSAGVQSLPSHEVRCAGGSSVMPSHHTSPSSVRATLVKTELPFSIVAMAFGLVAAPVPGATPNRPNSGLTAYSRPSSPKRIQAMSSPTISAVQPGMVGLIIARFVLPQADGNAAAM